MINVHDKSWASSYYATVCKRNYCSPYGILLVKIPLVAVLFISINNNIVIGGKTDQKINCPSPNCNLTSME